MSSPCGTGVNSISPSGRETSVARRGPSLSAIAATSYSPERSRCAQSPVSKNRWSEVQHPASSRLTAITSSELIIGPPILENHSIFSPSEVGFRQGGKHDARNDRFARGDGSTERRL